jgi:hypothetical protein
MSDCPRPDTGACAENALLLLTAALSPDVETVAHAWRCWQKATDLDALPAAQSALLPQLYANLLRFGLADEADPRIKGVCRRAWYHQQLILRLASGLLPALASAGIPVLLADAVPLALTIYDSSPRSLHSLAIIVPPQRVPDARHILADLGWYASRPAVVPGGPTPWVSSQRFRTTPAASALFVDLHWRAASFWPSEAMEAAVWGRAQPLMVGDQAASALSPADQLAGSCWAAATPGPHVLISLADVAALLQRGAIDWDAVVAIAVLGQMRRALLAVLEEIEALVAISAPTAALAKLQALPATRFDTGARALPLAATGAPSRVQTLMAAYARYRRMVAAQDLRPPPWGFLTYVQQRRGCASWRDLLRC